MVIARPRKTPVSEAVNNSVGSPTDAVIDVQRGIPRGYGWIHAPRASGRHLRAQRSLAVALILRGIKYSHCWDYRGPSWALVGCDLKSGRLIVDQQRDVKLGDYRWVFNAIWWPRSKVRVGVSNDGDGQPFMGAANSILCTRSPGAERVWRRLLSVPVVR